MLSGPLSLSRAGGTAAAAATTTTTTTTTTTADAPSEDAARVAWVTSTWAGRYEAGRVRGSRLLVVSARAPAASLMRREAWRRAWEELSAARDTHAFKACVGAATGEKAAEVAADAATWLERVERENRVTRQNLENAVLRAKAEAVKEPMRVALVDLGMFFLEAGDTTNALKTLVQVKDVCATQSQHLDAAVRVLEAALEAGNYGTAGMHAPRAEHLATVMLSSVQASASSSSGAAAATTTTTTTTTTTAKTTALAALNKIMCTQALVDLDRKKYRAAARAFAGVVRDAPVVRVLSHEDVATYAVVCALATFSRSEIVSHVLDNAAFKPMMEAVPAVRALATAFVDSDYSTLVSGLSAAKSLLALDPHLGPHVDALVSDIRMQAVSQAVAPYSTVLLSELARVFATSETAMEAEVAHLIAKGVVKARIDSQNKMVVARGEDQRDAAFARAVTVGEDYVRETKAAMFRASLLEHNAVFAVGSGGFAGAGRGGSGSGSGRGRQPQAGGGMGFGGHMDFDAYHDDGGGDGDMDVAMSGDEEDGVGPVAAAAAPGRGGGAFTTAPATRNFFSMLGR